MGIKTWILVAGRQLQTKIKAFACRKVLTHGDDLHLGARTRIWAPSHVRMGNQVYVGKDVHIEANCRIGHFCLVANRVAIVGRHDHDFSAVGYPVRFSPWVGSKRLPSQYAHEEAVIEDDVWLGYGTIVLTGVTVGRGSVVAAGSVVTRDIPPYSIAAGVPAKVIGKRFDDQATIDRHEAAIRDGHFRFSERGYDHCLIEPALPLADSSHS
ncbi:MAG: CatB-related O-acetyltransferase [Thiobacillus sp.]|nr:CatB-related O-acetyltransferase [Thiobacillus sp.]